MAIDRRGRPADHSRYVLMAVGRLESPKVPDIADLDKYCQ